MNISDVTLLIASLVNEDMSDICEICADVNLDGMITVSDATTLINMVLMSN